MILTDHSTNRKDYNGKQLVVAALKHERLPAVPWVPFAGVHAGRLKGYTAREVLTDVGKLTESLLAVHELYLPDGQPVVFDLQVEAEILGCSLLWSEDAPPSVADHPLETNPEIPTYLPESTNGRLPLILEATRNLKQAVGETTAIYGLITGPFTLASHLRGTEVFMDMFDNPDYLHALMDYTTRVAERIASFYIEAGVDVLAVVDPVVSQISQRHFSAFLSDPFSRLFGAIRQAGVLSSFFVCGNATKNLDVMCKTAPDGIAVDENIDLAAAKQVIDRYNITVQGNIPLTTRMLLGTQQDNMAYVIDLFDQIEEIDRNLILSPGCDMPYDTPVENVIGVAEAVRNPDMARKVLQNYQAGTFDMAVSLPDYKNLPKPLVEVFTLDSSTCAACGYMLNAAQRAVNEFGGRVDMFEYKMTSPENVARLNAMGIKNLPSIVINGELKFSSLIPSNRELVAEIEKHLG